MPDVGNGTVAVIGKALGDNSNTGRTVAFVVYILIVFGSGAALVFLKGAVDVVVGHVFTLCPGDDSRQFGVAGRIGTAFTDSDGHLAGILCEYLCLFGVLRAFCLLYIMPFGMSRHNRTSYTVKSAQTYLSISINRDRVNIRSRCGDGFSPLPHMLL